MIDFYFWPTPNGYKVALFLEESGLRHTVKAVDIGKGEQFEPAFLAISPSNKMPAIVDRAPADGGDAVSVFESGAILLYLAGKTGRFIPTDSRARMQCIEWLFWQMAGLGPMTGQYGHFHVYAPEKIPYAMARYRNDAERLLGVLATNACATASSSWATNTPLPTWPVIRGSIHIRRHPSTLGRSRSCAAGMPRSNGARPRDARMSAAGPCAAKVR